MMEQLHCSIPTGMVMRINLSLLAPGAGLESAAMSGV